MQFTYFTYLVLSLDDSLEIGPRLTFSLLGMTPSLLDMTSLYNIALFDILDDLIETESFTGGCYS